MGADQKHNNFQRLAMGRTNRALKQFNLLENLVGSAYTYSQDELDKITNMLQKGLDALKTKFNLKNFQLNFDDED